MKFVQRLAIGGAAMVLACSVTDAGAGAETFTTWGEEFIENEIPAGDGENGFVDGWRVKFSKFLVVYHNITVADDAGNVAAKLSTPRFVDNVKPGVKELVSFTGLEAKAYTNVSYEIRPAVAEAMIVGGADPADLAMMVANGYSIYVEGIATKVDPANAALAITKNFHWGFRTQTLYSDCHSAEEQGLSVQGIVVTTNRTDVSELTTHGDHFFYDSLQSGDNARRTMLRFEEKAAADDLPNGNGDGDISIAELCTKNIDPNVYNLSGLPGTSVGDFVISLARTVGHFRGEGECTVKRIDTPAATVANPCDEY